MLVIPVTLHWRVEGLQFEVSQSKKLVRPVSTNKKDVWRMPVTPTRREAKVGGSQSQASLGKKPETPSEK
jgi:hypothetical protein